LHVRLADPTRRPDAERVLTQMLGVTVCPESDPAALTARVSDPERVAHSLGELTRSGISVAEFSLGQPSLDEVFLALTGHPAEAPNEGEPSDEDEEDAA
jgi:ABC-2 type transport system ATP-binding protein